MNILFSKDKTSFSKLKKLPRRNKKKRSSRRSRHLATSKLVVVAREREERVVRTLANKSKLKLASFDIKKHEKSVVTTLTLTFFFVSV